MSFPPVASLCTFTPTGGGAVALGSSDCWISVRPEGAFLTWEVHCRYVRNEPGDPNNMMTGPMRSAAEQYFHELVASLGGVVPPQESTVANRQQGFFPRWAVSGRLQNPFTGLDETGLYLTGATLDSDDGWRAYEFTLVFQRARTSPADDYLITWNGTPIGNANGYIRQEIIANERGRVRWTVQTFYTGTRTQCESYLSTLAATLKPRPLQVKDPYTFPHEQAVSGTLANPETSLSQDGLYCVDLSSSDQGHNRYEVVAVFETATGHSSDPNADTDVPKIDFGCSNSGLINVGNRKGIVKNGRTSWDFTRYIVEGSYKPADDADRLAYPATLSTSLGTDHNETIVLARGGGRVMTECSVASFCIRWRGSVLENLYLESLELSENDGIVEVKITAVKGRND